MGADIINISNFWCPDHAEVFSLNKERKSGKEGEKKLRKKKHFNQQTFLNSGLGSNIFWSLIPMKFSFSSLSLYFP